MHINVMHEALQSIVNRRARATFFAEQSMKNRRGLCLSWCVGLCVVCPQALAHLTVMMPSICQ